MYHLIVHILAVWLTSTAHFQFISEVTWDTEEECRQAYVSPEVKTDLNFIIKDMGSKGFTDISVESFECKSEGKDVP